MKKVKDQPEGFLFAEGVGDSIDMARNKALKNLCDQISTNVYSNTTVKTIEEIVGKDIEVKQVFDQVIQTFSNLKLENYQSFIVGLPKGKDKFYTAFAYIDKKQVDKIITDMAREEVEMYKKRMEDVEYFYENGTNSMKTMRVGDAMKKFYWGYVLSKGTTFKLDTEKGNVPADTYLHTKIASLLDNIQVSVADITEEKINSVQSCYKLTLNFTYKDASMKEAEKVTSLAFCVNDGSNWTKNVNVRDGIGYVEITPISLPETLKIRCIYKSDGSETPDMLKKYVENDNTIFLSSEKQCSTKSKQKMKATAAETIVAKEIKSIVAQTTDATRDHKAMFGIMQQVEQAIRSNDYESVRRHFTDDGFKNFKALCNSGHAVIIGKPQYQFVDFMDITICRSITMKFCYSNKKEFTENVSFRFTPDNKIESIAYMLSTPDQQAILCDTTANPNSRMALLTFMEDYQTAYALGDIDYLNRVFSEDALIIIGHKIQTKKREISVNETKYSTLSKSQFINRLRNQVDRREYINLNFTETEFRQAANVKGVFGIQVRQEYCSNVYGDVGYLFLLVDMREKAPVIHVRVWNENHTPVNDRFSIRDIDW